MSDTPAVPAGAYGKPCIRTWIPNGWAACGGTARWCANAAGEAKPWTVLAAAGTDGDTGGVGRYAYGKRVGWKKRWNENINLGGVPQGWCIIAVAGCLADVQGKYRSSVATKVGVDPFALQQYHSRTHVQVHIIAAAYRFTSYSFRTLENSHLSDNMSTGKGSCWTYQLSLRWKDFQWDLGRMNHQRSLCCSRETVRSR